MRFILCLSLIHISSSTTTSSSSSSSCHHQQHHHRRRRHHHRRHHHHHDDHRHHHNLGVIIVIITHMSSPSRLAFWGKELASVEIRQILCRKKKQREPDSERRAGFSKNVFLNKKKEKNEAPQGARQQRDLFS